MNALYPFTLLALSLPAMATTVNTEDYPPFNFMKDGKVAGIASDIVQEAFKRAGQPIKHQLLPWERAIGAAEKEADTCVHSAIRSEKREPLFKWVGPVVTDEWQLMAKADSTIPQLKSLEDAKKYRIGGYQGDALTQYVIDQKVPVDVVNQNKLNLPKLGAGRIDLWIGTKMQAPGMAEREGGFKVKSVLTFGDAKNHQMWLACNKGMSDATISKLNEAMKAVYADGTADKIAKKYQ